MTPTEILTKETFASMAASVLRFIVDGTITDPPMLERIQAFQAVKARAINETGDIRGVRISTPDISGETDEPGSSDCNTNAILRGSLLMVAAMLEGGVDSDAYRDAREQLAVGVSNVIDAVQAARKPRQRRRRV
jgi:hypothetical protein